MTHIIPTNGGMGVMNAGGGTLRRGRAMGKISFIVILHNGVMFCCCNTHSFRNTLYQIFDVLTFLFYSIFLFSANSFLEWLPNISWWTNTVPPPDVTHHTTNHSKSTHDLHNSLNQAQTANKQPPGILKDPNRSKQHQQQQQQQMMPHSNMQILNVQNVAPGLGNNLLMSSGVSTYEPNTHNLSSFNASMGYTDADGHLV